MQWEGGRGGSSEADADGIIMLNVDISLLRDFSGDIEDNGQVNCRFGQRNGEGGGGGFQPGGSFGGGNDGEDGGFGGDDGGDGGDGGRGRDVDEAEDEGGENGGFRGGDGGDRGNGGEVGLDEGGEDGGFGGGDGRDGGGSNGRGGGPRGRRFLRSLQNNANVCPNSDATRFIVEEYQLSNSQFLRDFRDVFSALLVHGYDTSQGCTVMIPAASRECRKEKQFRGAEIRTTSSRKQHMWESHLVQAQHQWESYGFPTMLENPWHELLGNSCTHVHYLFPRQGCLGFVGLLVCEETRVG